MIAFQIAQLIIGLALIPRAIQESHEPWFSLWLDWAEQHIDNDFEYVDTEWTYETCEDPYHNGCNFHPENWYDEEFEIWLDLNGYDPYNRDNYHAISNLQKYLVRHKYVIKKCWWNQWIYQINSKKIY